MTSHSSSSADRELSYSMNRFTSWEYVTSLYVLGNHRHICEDCKCLRCVILRWVRMAMCDCRLPPPRHGLSLDNKIRKKSLACRLEPQCVPIFPPEFCFCDHPEQRKAQEALLKGGYSSTDDIYEFPSDSSKHEEDSFLDLDNAHSNDIDVQCFRKLRRL